MMPTPLSHTHHHLRLRDQASAAENDDTSSIRAFREEKRQWSTQVESLEKRLEEAEAEKQTLMAEKQALAHDKHKLESNAEEMQAQFEKRVQLLKQSEK